MDPKELVSLGIALPFILIQFQYIRVLWAKLESLHKQSHEDQAAMLPALTAASAVMDKVTNAMITRQAIIEHENR